MKKLRTSILTIIISIGLATQLATAETVPEVIPEEEPEPPPIIVEKEESEWIALTVEDVTTKPTPEYKADIPLDPEIIEYIITKCEENNIDVDIFLALIEVESNYNRNAINYNKNGSFDSGLCQINSSNYGWLSGLGFNDLGDVYGNIDAGVYILLLNLEKTGYDYPRALTGYNTGRTDYVNSYANKVINITNESI